MHLYVLLHTGKATIYGYGMPWKRAVTRKKNVVSLASVTYTNLLSIAYNQLTFDLS